MRYGNFNQQNVQEKNNKDASLNVGAAQQLNLSVKVCKHRNENGWCSKSRRQCPLLNLIFINQ